MSTADLSAAARPAGPPGVDDIYPLSPLQQGILYHALLEPGSGVYLTQAHWRLAAVEAGVDLDPHALRAAWEAVLAHHPVLRTSFVWKRQRPLQVVRSRVPTPWRQEDWRGLPEAEREERFADLLDRDRAAGFDPGKAPLVRLTLVREGDGGGQGHGDGPGDGQGSWRLLWTYHHLLLDGWSAGLVLHDVLTAYRALTRGETPRLPERRPYRDLVTWLGRQDPAAVAAHWRRELAGFTAATPLPEERQGQGGERARAGQPGPPARAPGAGETDPGSIDRHTKLEAWLGQEASAALDRWVRRQGLTLAVLAQGLWGLLLGHRAGRRDVLFGLVVAGRPQELEGFETMVGLFINTLPVRLRLDPEASLGDWLRGVQRRQLAHRSLEHSSLVEIQAASAVPRGEPLFESLLVFDNYPVSEALGSGSEAGDGAGAPGAPSGGTAGSGLVVSEAGGFDQNSAALTLTLWPGERLGIELDGVDRRFARAGLERILEDVRSLLEAVAAAEASGEASGKAGAPTLNELQGVLAAADRRRRDALGQRLGLSSRDRLRSLRPRGTPIAGGSQSPEPRPADPETHPNQTARVPVPAGASQDGGDP